MKPDERTQLKRRLASRLSACRRSLGITQQQAANAICVPRSAISRIEHGHRLISTLELAGLASLYHRPIIDFFTP